MATSAAGAAANGKPQGICPEGDVEKLEHAPILRHAGGSVGSYGIDKPAVVGKEEPDDSDELISKAVGRHPCFDVIRIVCIWLVCVDHGGTTFGVWNVMYVQSWVLQYLFLICGVSFGMTSRSLLPFLYRLAQYFCIGVGCNLSAWIILGLDWKHNIFNVVFQFWFIVALVMFLLILAPLKAHCKGVRDCMREAAARRNVGDQEVASFTLTQGLLYTAAGFVLISFIFSNAVIPVLQMLLAKPLLHLVTEYLGSGAEYWNMPTTEEASWDFVRQLFSYFQLSVTNLYLVVVFPKLSTRLSLVVWLVLLNTYSNKMVLYRAQEARLINGFDCVMLGLVCFYYGVAWRRKIGKYLVRYWLVVLFVCALLWRPGAYGRLDENPPTDLKVRMQYNLLECLFVVLFLTTLDRSIDAKIFTEDKLEFLGNWALLLFLVHKAVHLLFPSPFNWAILIGLACPCWLLYPKEKEIGNTEKQSESNDR